MSEPVRRLVKVPGTDHTYSVEIRCAPGGEWTQAGIVQRFGSLPSMQSWAGRPEGAKGWTPSRRLRAIAADDVAEAYARLQAINLQLMEEANR